MEKIDSLPNSPKYVKDLSVIANALYTLELLEGETGKRYVFEYIQQPMVGGTCHPVPQDSPRNGSCGTRVIARFDTNYVKNHLLKQVACYDHFTFRWFLSMLRNCSSLPQAKAGRLRREQFLTFQTEIKRIERGEIFTLTSYTETNRFYFLTLIFGSLNSA